MRDLNGPDAINDASQAVIYNAIAYALESTSTYSKNVANLINTFFLAPATKMNPNMNFGQIVRGPGPDGVSGTFTGVLDLRGIVKIINGIAIVKAAGSPDWTQAFDQQMNFWLTDYVNWLKTSSVGQITASRPKSSKFSLFYIFELTSFLIVPVIMAHSMPRKLQPRKFYWGISKVPHWNFRNSALARSWIRWHNPGSSHSRPYVLDHSTIATLISRH